MSEDMLREREMSLHINRKDVGAGAFFIAVGLLYGGIALASLPMGTALNMGPGYFPIVLSGIVICLGIAIAVRGLSTGKDETPFGHVPWRGLLLLSLATIVFAAFFEHLGMLPGVFVSTWIAALAKPRTNILKAGFISLCIAVFCTAVFSYGIALPVPVFGDWLSR